MVEPVGYANMWQKFETDVYRLIKKELQGTLQLRVNWNYEIQGLKPDVLAWLQCPSCRESRQGEPPCLVPAFIFDAYCKFEVDKEYFKKKDEQMQKYAKICDAVLVMPHGYEDRAFCKSEAGKYHIVSFPYLYTFARSVKQAIELTYREDCCGDRPKFNASHVYKHFELSIRSSVDKCPSCKQKVAPISLLFCSQYNEYYDADFIEDECGDCPNKTFGWSYEDCPFLSIETKFQCKKCGAIFDPEDKKIIDSFGDSFFDMVISEYPYYKKD